MLRADCSSCPAHSVSPSENVADCACEPGYTGPEGGECSVCPAGKYKPTNGSSECTDCAAGKFSVETVGISESSCGNCPSNSESRGGSTTVMNCTCKQGFTGVDGAECSPCIPGMYKEVNGSAACTQCSQGKYSGMTAATSISMCVDCPRDSYNASDNSMCLPCPSYSTSSLSSDELTDCLCNMGYTGPDGGNCTQCSAGKYKPTNGSSGCIDCEAGKHSAATNATACEQCPGNQSSLPASTSQSDCGCLLGYYDDQSAGHILHYDAPGTGSPGWCLDVNECINVSHCFHEHMNCVNEPGSFHCECNTGYERVIMDQDEPQLEVFACANVNECERVEYQTCHERAYCIDTDGSFTCTCFLGLSGDGIVADNGGTACFEDNGGFCESSSNRTNDCHESAVCSYDIIHAPGSFICTCNMGFVGLGTDCEDADECSLTGSGCYQYQSILSLSLCVGSGEAQASPAACSPNALCSNTVGSFMCTCYIGYVGDGTVCVSCAPGTYKAAAGNNGSCLECSPNTYQNASGASSCLDCAQNAISAAASGNHSDCLCMIAFSGPNGGACSACQAGTYKSIVGSSVCAPCSAFSDSPRQSSLLKNCTCNRGETDAGNVPFIRPYACKSPYPSTRPYPSAA